MTSPKPATCEMRHVLQAGGLGHKFEYCYICQDLSLEKAQMVMHCSECSHNVCERCTGLYKDIGFAMFLSKTDNRGSLLPYMEDPQCATTPSYFSQAQEVYFLHEEYNDTPMFRRMLEQKIRKARRDLLDMEDRLAASKLRAANAEFASTSFE